MADIKISALPVATTVADADSVVINQSGVTKTAPRSLVKGGNVGTVTSISAGTGLSGGTITSSGTIAVNYGTSATTACNGNDVRLSDARTPLGHKSSHESGGSDQITSLALTAGTISTTPGAANDIVNKSYADSIGSGVNFHDACNYTTIASLSAAYTYSNGTLGVGATITANAVGTLTIDGYTLLGTDVGKRLLIKNEVGAFTNNTTPSAAFNGIYTLTTAGTASVPYVLTRASDYDTSGSGTNEVQAGDFILILSGTQANTAWVQQTALPIVLGSTSLSFSQFAAAAAGVTSFKTDLSGLTPSTNTTGAVTLSGTLGFANGGTGATSQQAALNAIAGSQVNKYHFRSDGTNVTLGAMSVDDVTAGTLGILNGGTGATTAATALSNLGGVKTANVQPFTSSGIWNKPDGAKVVVFEVVSGGGGGGAGGKAAAGIAVYGGSGGGGSGFTIVTYAASDLADASYSVAVGGAGAGGIFSGAVATGGGISTVTGGTQGIIARSTNGSGGGAGTTTVGAAGGAGAFIGNGGGTGSVAATANGGSGSNRAPASGAAGGGCSTTAPFAGGIGGSNVPFGLAGGSSGTLSTAGNGGTGGTGNFKTGLSTASLTGSGGGGGGATTFATGSGGNGGDGTLYGCAGGGGGATQGSGNGGNGGNGAAGIVIITTYF